MLRDDMTVDEIKAYMEELKIEFQLQKYNLLKDFSQRQDELQDWFQKSLAEAQEQLAKLEAFKLASD